MQWAYHATQGDEAAIAMQGLVPHSGSIGSRTDEVIFFTPSVSDALFWISEREESSLIRFPWPSDARGGGNEYTSQQAVPPEEIQIYVGNLLDPILDVAQCDWDTREAVLDQCAKRGVAERIERSKQWSPIR